MKKRLFQTAMLAFLFVCACFEINGFSEQGKVRLPAVEGSFYPQRPEELRAAVNGYLDKAQTPSLEGEELLGLIVPHAGYVFSAEVAAHAYNLLKDKKYEVIVLLGDSHRHRFRGVSVGDYSYYRTALGDVEVDTDMVRELIQESEEIGFHPAAHQREHSLEVQLPFLKTVQKDFKIVPIIMGERSLQVCRTLSNALVKHTKGKNVLFIASTDLSHYHPYQQAAEIDKRAVSAMEALDGELLFEGVNKNEYELCAAAATVTLMLASRQSGADRVRLLKYANSGDVPFGDRAGVVGYAAMAVTKKNNPANIETFARIDERTQKILLEIARMAIEGYALTRATPRLEPEQAAVLNEKRGVFVSIYKNGQLRGCIGTHAAELPLYQQVAKTAIDAAFFDNRFPGLRKEEIKDIKIELSVYLSGLVRIDDVNRYQIGEHGIIMQKGLRGATFLPKVPVEQGWDKKETLEQLCRKAGLGLGCWQDDDVVFYVYSTQVFGE